MVGTIGLCVSPSLGQRACGSSNMERACGGQSEDRAACKQSRGQIKILLSSCVVPEQGSGPPPDRSVPSEDSFVVGAGFGRMGTSSLQMALNVLGFGNTYHMKVCGRVVPACVCVCVFVYVSERVCVGVCVCVCECV